MAVGELRAMSSARAWVTAASSSGATTWPTIPSWWARAASIRSWRPVSAMRTIASIGEVRPRAMASYAVTWPTDTWGSRKRASVEATTMSASATKWRPPPAHTPLTAAITGLRTPLCQALMRSSARLVRRDCSRSAAGSRASWATSSPVWNEAPAPVLTMTRTSGSASSSAQAASSSASMVASMALPTSGRSNVSHPTGPRRSTRRVV